MNKIFKYVALLFAGILIGTVGAQLIKEYFIPTTGDISTVKLSITWLDGSPVTTIDWGTVDNSTEYILEPINITNVSNTPVNLTLSSANLNGVIDLTLTWNYTDTPIQPLNFVIVELTQNVTATGAFTYDTVITGEPS